MGDKVAIPRSFADNIGVQDTLPSIRRKYIAIPLFSPQNNTTTGIMFGADSNTTGLPFLSRNFTLERLFVSGFKQTTVNGKTTLLTLQAFKNGASTLFDLTISNSTTLAQRWQADSTTPDISNLISTDRISVRIPTRNQMTQLSVVVVGRERADS